MTRPGLLGLGWALGAALLVSCAAVGTPPNGGGGHPPIDPRGVPMGGTAAAFHPGAVPNFYGATSLGAPGSGAFAGSGPAAIEQANRVATGERLPKTIPQIPPPDPLPQPEPAVPPGSVLVVPAQPAATPAAAPPDSPAPQIFEKPGTPQPQN